MFYYDDTIALKHFVSVVCLFLLHEGLKLGVAGGELFFAGPLVVCQVVAAFTLNRQIDQRPETVSGFCNFGPGVGDV